MNERTEKRVEIGTECVVIDKVFGPTIFVDLRITPDIERAEWLIERATGPEGIYVEWCRIPGQMDLDFIDWDKVSS